MIVNDAAKYPTTVSRQRPSTTLMYSVKRFLPPHHRWNVTLYFIFLLPLIFFLLLQRLYIFNPREFIGNPLHPMIKRFISLNTKSRSCPHLSHRFNLHIFKKHFQVTLAYREMHVNIGFIKLSIFTHYDTFYREKSHYKTVNI